MKKNDQNLKLVSCKNLKKKKTKTKQTTCLYIVHSELAYKQAQIKVVNSPSFL